MFFRCVFFYGEIIPAEDREQAFIGFEKQYVWYDRAVAVTSVSEFRCVATETVVIVGLAYSVQCLGFLGLEDNVFNLPVIVKDYCER